MSQVKDMTKESFNRLTVLERAMTSRKGEVYWRCRCRCGAETVVRGSSLRRGVTQSCGCLQRERVRIAAVRTRILFGKKKALDPDRTLADGGDYGKVQ